MNNCGLVESHQSEYLCLWAIFMSQMSKRQKPSWQICQKRQKKTKYISIIHPIMTIIYSLYIYIYMQEYICIHIDRIITGWGRAVSAQC